MTTRDERGFTLPELLVAITILGIIMVTIGAMIATAFRTSTTVSAELAGSRAPKSLSRYWIPDVEQAENVGTDPTTCGAGDNLVAMMPSHLPLSAFQHADAGVDPGPTRTIAYWEKRTGQRDQLVRWVCDEGTAARSLVVVPDLVVDPHPALSTHGASATLSVTVPDRSRTNDEYAFDVTGTSMVTTVTT